MSITFASRLIKYFSLLTRSSWYRRSASASMFLPSWPGGPLGNSESGIMGMSGNVGGRASSVVAHCARHLVRAI